MRIPFLSVPEPLVAATRACRPHLYAAACFSALINILYLAPTIYMMQVYDRVVPTGGVVTLLWITVIVGVALATLALLDAMRMRLLVRASLRLNSLLSHEILDRLMARTRVGPGQVSTTQAMREFDSLRHALGGQAATAILDAPWTPLYLLVAFMIHPVLGALVLAGGAVLVCLAVANARRSRSGADRAHSATARAYAAQEATIANGEAIRALGMRRATVARQIADRREGLNAQAEIQFAGSRYNGLVKFVRMFLQSAALGVGALLAINGQISVGAIIAASVLLSRGLQPIEQLVAAWPAIGQARQALKTLESLFANTEASAAHRTALPDPEGYLRFEKVGLRAADGAMIVRNLSFELEPGEMLGVIGASGAGKSALARLAAGALAPHQGEIRVDGANATDWNPELLAQYVGYMPQDSGLLPGSVSENISRFAVARGAAPPQVDHAVVKAARAAGIHDMILRLPAGYDTQLDPSGRQLSVGQAQRVALARALFGDPRILVLDEPNAALDAEGEDALGSALADAKSRGAAILVVAHRPSVLRDADRLLVMCDGSISRIGPSQQILDTMKQRSVRANIVPIKERA